MRLFWALVPPTQVRAAVEAAVAPARLRSPELRWVSADRWHVTLAFLGDVDADLVGPLADAVAAAVAATPPVAVELAARADVAAGRVLWLPVADDGPLTPLVGAVRAACRPLAPADERLPWRGHLTLARRPRGRTAADLRDAAAAIALPGPARWTADRLVLLSSSPGPQAPAYAPVASAALAGPAPPPADGRFPGAGRRRGPG